MCAPQSSNVVVLFKDGEVSVAHPGQKCSTADASWSTTQQGHLSLVTIGEVLQRGHGRIPDLGNLHGFENLSKSQMLMFHHIVVFNLKILIIMLQCNTWLCIVSLNIHVYHIQ